MQLYYISFIQPINAIKYYHYVNEPSLLISNSYKNHLHKTIRIDKQIFLKLWYSINKFEIHTSNLLDFET